MDSKKLLAALFFILPGFAFAECSSNACNDVKVEEMQIATSGIVWIQTGGNEALLASSVCTPDSGIFIKLDTSTNGGKNIYSALLSAQAQSKNVSIKVTNGVTPCQVEYINAK